MKRDDSLWKAILEDVFDEFLRFFVPDADAVFDMERGFSFLDKELEQLFPVDANDLNPRYVDKLVKVFLKTGTEQWVLVHIEVQGKADPEFAARMFQYFTRIYDKYKRPVAAFAILTDGNRRFNPGHFSSRFLGTELTYRFSTYKVLEQDPVRLAHHPNPFAYVILTTRLAIEHRSRRVNDLLEEKLNLVRGLLERQLPKEKIRALMNFLRLYVRFGDVDKDRIFEEAVEVLTNKRPETMGIEEFILARAQRIGLQQGLKEGLKKGMKEGMKEGIREGKKEGRDEGINLMIAALLKETDFNDERIAGLAGVPIERVRALREQQL